MRQNHIRYLGQNHILFKEAIVAFSKLQVEKTPALIKIHETNKDSRIYGYLIFDFNLTENIDCGDFTILKSEKVYFNLKDKFGQQTSWTYISAVKLPEYVNFLNSHLYTLALSSLCSFAFERPVYSATENMYEQHLNQKANSEELKRIGISFPILSLGNDGTESRVHSSIISQWSSNFKELYQVVEKLSTLNVFKSKLSYDTFFQIIRLVQLSLQNKKYDFDLSFSLLIAAIESTATFYTEAISPARPPEHKKWLKLRESTDPIIKKLAETYVNLWGNFSQVEKDSQLLSRFIKFIFDCAPKETWEATIDDDLLRDGLGYRDEYPNEVSSQTELTPESFPDKNLKDIINKTYSYRSKFIHKGESTPHEEHKNSNRNRFFERTLNMSRYNKYKKKTENQIDLDSLYDFHAKYELVRCITRVSITEYAKRTLQNLD
jgi:hypothetical protein